jgi:hypothetical protein
VKTNSINNNKGNKMGYYINPTGETKEEFLRRKGITVSNTFKWKERLPNTLPVILIDNGYFTAAGIAYSEREFDGFLDPNDDRPKIMFLVNIEDLFAVSNLTRDTIQE